MRGSPGVAGRVFGTLGRHGCNILAIAQGGSELNISCVLPAGDEGRAMRALHDDLIAAPPGTGERRDGDEAADQARQIAAVGDD